MTKAPTKNEMFIQSCVNEAKAKGESDSATLESVLTGIDVVMAIDPTSKGLIGEVKAEAQAASGLSDDQTKRLFAGIAYARRPEFDECRSGEGIRALCLEQGIGSRDAWRVWVKANTEKGREDTAKAAAKADAKEKAETLEADAAEVLDIEAQRLADLTPVAYLIDRALNRFSGDIPAAIDALRKAAAQLEGGVDQS